MNFVMYLVLEFALLALAIWIGLVIGQWANLPTSEWDKIDSMTRRDAIAKLIRWSYWSIKRFFWKAFKLYPFND